MSDFKAQFVTYFSIEHDNFSILNLFINKKVTLDQLIFPVYEKWNYKLFSALNFGMIPIYPMYLKTVSSTIPSK